MNSVVCAIALGSNLGDRQGHLEFALAALRQGLTQLRASGFHETAPIDAPGPAFLNAAAVAATDLSARQLLALLMAIEAARGRERPYACAPRTLDLDLILYGDAIIDGPDLVVPHPRFRGRRFVLAPLAEVAPDLRDPVTEQTVAELLAGLGAG